MKKAGWGTKEAENVFSHTAGGGGEVMIIRCKGGCSWSLQQLPAVCEKGDISSKEGYSILAKTSSFLNKKFYASTKPWFIPNFHIPGLNYNILESIKE